jgi:hypothetical protein
MKSCNCPKSRCVILYCTCFNQGIGCCDTCKCKNCENPKGRRGGPAPAPTAPIIPQRRDPKYLLMLTVSPGRLGLTLSMVPNANEVDGGAEITHIDPACTFLGEVEVGDRVITVDGVPVTKLEDLVTGKERTRKFGILKKIKKPTFPLPTDRLPERKIMSDLLQWDRKNNRTVSIAGIRGAF